MWIARDENQELCIYATRPIRDEEKRMFYDTNGDLASIPSDFFPEVTWENSPKELIIKEEDKTIQQYMGSYKTTTEVYNGKTKSKIKV